MPTRIPATVAVLTKNEELALADCLASVADFNKVYVIDSASTDATKDIAHQMGATVLDFDWDHQYPKKKQWALDHVESDTGWVLLLDADERVTPELSQELAAFLADEARAGVHGAVDIPLLYEWQGRPLLHGHQVVKRAMVQRDRCRFPVVDDLAVANMWEVEGHYQPQTDRPVWRATAKLYHRDPDPLFDWFARHNRYSDWESYLRRSRHDADVATLRTQRGARFARLPGKPIIFFLYAYLLKAGFRDGRAGLDYAIAQSFYYWQIDLKARAPVPDRRK